MVQIRITGDEYAGHQLIPRAKAELETLKTHMGFNSLMQDAREVNFANGVRILCRIVGELRFAEIIVPPAAAARYLPKLPPLKETALNDIYAATRGHHTEGADYLGPGYVHRARNLSWTLWGQIPDMPEVADIAIFKGVFYALAVSTPHPFYGEDSAGIYKSPDGGQSWQKVFDLTADHYEPPLVERHRGRLAVLGGCLYAITNKGIWDEGESEWTHRWAEIYKSSDGSSWSLFHAFDDGYEAGGHHKNNVLGDMAATESHLYVSIHWNTDERDNELVYGKVYRLSPAADILDVTLNWPWHNAQVMHLQVSDAGRVYAAGRSFYWPDTYPYGTATMFWMVLVNDTWFYLHHGGGLCMAMATFKAQVYYLRASDSKAYNPYTGDFRSLAFDFGGKSPISAVGAKEALVIIGGSPRTIFLCRDEHTVSFQQELDDTGWPTRMIYVPDAAAMMEATNG